MAKKPKVHTLDSILKELRAAMRSGLAGTPLSKKAKNYLEKSHRGTVKEQLRSGRANWDSDKKRALPVARKLGRVARVLTTTGAVQYWAAEAAHDAVKRDPGCPSGMGAGGYCDF